MKIRIDPRRLDEGLAAVAATREAVGDTMAIMVDLNQGWRMAGDTSALDRRPRPPGRSPSGSPSSTSCGWRSRSPARTCAGWPRCARPAPGIRIAGGEMTRTFAEELRGPRRGRVRRLPAGRGPRRRHAPDADAGGARAGPQPLVHAAHVDERARVCWPTSTSRPASAAGRSSSSRTTRRAGRRSAATPSWPSRSGRDPTASCGCRTPPGWARPRRGRDPRGTRHDGDRAPAPGRRRGWLARAAAIRPRTELFIDGAFVPAASGRTFADITGRDGSTIAARRRGRRRGRRAGRGRGPAVVRRRPLGEPDPGQPEAGAAPARRADAGQPRRARAARVPRRRQSDPRRAARSTRRVGKTIQWYAETIDKVYGEVGPTGPDALSLVTREPIGVVAAIVPGTTR